MRYRATGLKAWRVQRISAVYLVLFATYVFGSLSMHPVHGYLQWRAWVASPAMTFAIVVLIAALVSHLWVGLRDVLLDYARPARLRHFLLAAVGAVLAGIALWAVLILVQAQR